jgi:hypothetical protein
VGVMSKTGHKRVVTGHVTVASELTAHGAAHDGVVWYEAWVLYSPHQLLLMCELDIG